MKRVLIIYDFFTPAKKAGGITRSLENLVKNQIDGIVFHVYTSAYDLDGSRLEVLSDQWQQLNNYTSIYYSSNPGFLKFHKVIQAVKPDVIYCNGLLGFFFNVIPIIYNFLSGKKKFIVAPRGMLQKGALAVKPIKKKVFLSLFSLLGFHHKITWHATDQQEVIDIRSRFKRATINCIPDTPDIDLKKVIHLPKKSHSLRLTFISLITEKKNIEYIIDLVLKLKMNLELDIYGPVKDKAYWNVIEKKIELSGNINYKGELDTNLVTSTLSKYHFLVLPTKGENFGHIIYEAFASGTPVIISDQTPWRNLSQSNAGWDLPLHQPQRWQDILRKCYEMEQPEYDKLCNGAHTLARAYIEKSNFKEQYKELFSTQ